MEDRLKASKNSGVAYGKSTSSLLRRLTTLAALAVGLGSAGCATDGAGGEFSEQEFGSLGSNLTITSSHQTGFVGSWFYTHWKDGGSASQTLNTDGTFSVNWQGGGYNYVGGPGWNNGQNDRVIGYNLSQDSGASYISLYGWSMSPLVEYYVLQRWTYDPSSGASQGITFTSNGVTYTTYRSQRVGKPSINGTQTFYQYWSKPNQQQALGQDHEIIFQDHVNAWAQNGWNLGNMQTAGSDDPTYQVIAVEVFNPGGSGTGAGRIWDASTPATCDDGIQNQGEAGVDCGGPCAACPVPGIPGRFEAEDYTNYNESDSSNQGGACDRGDGVDMESTSDSQGGNCNIAYTTSSEWLEYDFDAGSGGTFDVSARVAAQASQTFTLTIDGATIGGGAQSVNTGAWQTYTDVTVSNVAIAAGTHTLRFAFTSGDTNLNWIDFTSVSGGTPTCSDGIQNGDETGVDCGGSCPACSSATCSDGVQNQGETGVDCGGPCAACAAQTNVPGIVEAEDYFSFSDSDSGNQGTDPNCDNGDDVDIDTTTDSGGGCAVGWTASGEWLRYNLEVASTGDYDIFARVGSQVGSNFSVQIDGTNISGTLNTNTGSWTTYESKAVASSLSLAAGSHTMLVQFQGSLNFNFMEFVALTPCVPATTCSAGSVCGTEADGCGGTVSCGTCGAGEACNTGTNQCECVPATTCSTSQCGTEPDGCGGTIDCGSCAANETCDASNQCQCVPATSCSAGSACGTEPDGCGGTVDCGTCGAGEACNTGTNQCECVPATTCSAGAQCGTQADGCGGTINCGSCTGYDTCNAGTNLCEACVPATSCSGGAQCGTQSDGCGGTISCGSCGANEACNTGTNLCECVPATTCSAGAECGTQADGCGGTINCGSCTGYDTCNTGTNLCEACVPTTSCSAGAQCGTQDDGCGGTINCGSCTGYDTCNTGTNLCEACVPATTCSAGAQCGTEDDGCGGTVSCGTCGAGEQCNTGSNLCECVPATTCSAASQCGTEPDGCGGTISCGTCATGETCDGSNQCQSGPPPNVPGIIEAEDYFQFSDSDAGNQGTDPNCDNGDDVDIDTTTDGGGGCSVGWTANGEWLRYELQVATTGQYDVVARVGSAVGGSFNIKVDGTDISGTVNTNTGAWTTYESKTVATALNLTAGSHYMLVNMLGSLNFNYVEFVSLAPPTCDDGIQNQDETGVDCGGSTCAACPAGCTDGIQNQDETDVDCGGSICGACADGASCNLHSDCQSDDCTGNVCQSAATGVASCNDGNSTSLALNAGDLNITGGQCYKLTKPSGGSLQMGKWGQADYTADMVDSSSNTFSVSMTGDGWKAVSGVAAGTVYMMPTVTSKVQLNNW